MTDTNFPAPTLAAPVEAAPTALVPPVDTTPATTPAPLPSPSVDDARDAAERARTAGATVPKGLAPEAVETNEGRIVTMPYAGHDFKVYADEFTGCVFDWMVGGQATRAIKALIKEEQWALIKDWHMRDIKKFMDALSGLDLLGK